MGALGGGGQARRLGSSSTRPPPPCSSARATRRGPPATGSPRPAWRRAALGLGGGRCGCHGTAAHGRRPRGGAAARNRCSARATWASGQGWGRAAWGGLVEPGVEPRAPVVGESDGPSPRPRGRPGCRRAPARAGRGDLQGRGPGTDSARRARRPRPAGAEVVPAGTADRRDVLSGVGGHGSRLRAAREFTTHRLARRGSWRARPRGCRSGEDGGPARRRCRSRLASRRVPGRNSRLPPRRALLS